MNTCPHSCVCSMYVNVCSVAFLPLQLTQVHFYCSTMATDYTHNEWTV